MKGISMLLIRKQQKTENRNTKPEIFYKKNRKKEDRTSFFSYIVRDISFIIFRKFDISMVLLGLHVLHIFNALDMHSSAKLIQKQSNMIIDQEIRQLKQMKIPFKPLKKAATKEYEYDSDGDVIMKCGECEKLGNTCICKK